MSLHNAVAPPACCLVIDLQALIVGLCAFDICVAETELNLDTDFMVIMQVSYMTNNKLWSDEEAEHAAQKFAPLRFLGL